MVVHAAAACRCIVCQSTCCSVWTPWSADFMILLCRYKTCTASILNMRFTVGDLQNFDFTQTFIPYHLSAGWAALSLPKVYSLSTDVFWRVVSLLIIWPLISIWAAQQRCLLQGVFGSMDSGVQPTYLSVSGAVHENFVWVVIAEWWADATRLVLHVGHKFGMCLCSLNKCKYTWRVVTCSLYIMLFVLCYRSKGEDTLQILQQQFRSQ